MDDPTRPLAPDTIAVAAGRPAHVPGAPLNPPLVLTSTYVAGGDIEYGRYGSPVWSAFEDVLGELEGGRALAFASGLAAVTAVLDGVPDGSVVVAPRHAYLGTLGQLAEAEQRGRLTVRTVDIADTDAIRKACAGASLLWVESPTNPALEVADLEAACAAGREHGATVCVDNTFATPLLQRPLDAGADLVLHSATKYLAGHSDVQLGAVVTRDDQAYERLAAYRTHTGGIAGPFEAWLALRGVRTLHLRLERAQANAMTIAKRLVSHPGIERVRYPGLPGDPGHARAAAQMRGFGAIVCAEVRGGAATADALCANVALWVNATSLGGVESTLERRRRWSGEPTSIPDGLVRLSVGIEEVEDLWADLDRALHLSGPAKAMTE